jgi:RNA polymerase sigma-70 factor (ECF subfamily)
VEIVLDNVQPAEELAAAADLELRAAGVSPGGDARAAVWFEAIFEKHYPRIVGMLARLIGDRGHAEEIAADVFCKVASRPALPQAEDLTAWIYRVATNAGLDAIRSNARRRRREREAGAESVRSTQNEGALADLLRQERCARVREVLGALKPREAQLLLLRANGLAYRELAQSLGIHPASVGTLLARAEAEFEKKFRARYGGEA